MSDEKDPVAENMEQLVISALVELTQNMTDLEPELARLRAENERLRWMVRRLQERTRQLIQDNKMLAHDDTAEWGLEELMKDVGDSNE